MHTLPNQEAEKVAHKLVNEFSFRFFLLEQLHPTKEDNLSQQLSKKSVVFYRSKRPGPPVHGANFAAARHRRC